MIGLSYSLDPEKDAESLARYQSYAKHAIRQDLGKVGPQGGEGGQLLSAAFKRQVERVRELHGLSEQDAMRRVLAGQNQASVPGNVGYEEYLANLKSFIEVNNEHKKKDNESDADLKEEYPKSYMVNKANRLMDQKEGLSEFETYSGFSEVVYSRPVTKKQRYIESRDYNLNEM